MFIHKQRYVYCSYRPYPIVYPPYPIVAFFFGNKFHWYCHCLQRVQNTSLCIVTRSSRFRTVRVAIKGVKFGEYHIRFRRQVGGGGGCRRVLGLILFRKMTTTAGRGEGVMFEFGLGSDKNDTFRFTVDCEYKVSEAK